MIKPYHFFAASVSSRRANQTISTASTQKSFPFELRSKRLVLAAALLTISYSRLAAQTTPFVEPVSPFIAGANPSAVVVADVNGDGKLDILALSSRDGSVTMQKGDGNGGFSPGWLMGTGTPSLATSLVVGDFNGDGVPDFLVGYQANVPVLRCLGDTSSIGYGGIAGASNGGSDSLVAGDFNRDGKLDFASVGRGGVSVLLGGGTRTYASFTESFSFALPYSGKESLVALDVNLDSKLDLAINTPAGVTVLLGDGTGKFTVVPGSPFPAAGAGSGNLTTGDFNGDAKPDLASAGPVGVTILLGDGMGKFTAAQGSPFLSALGSSNAVVAAADFSGDGLPDLVLTNTAANNLTLLLNDGTGKFTAVPSPSSTWPYPAAVAVADFNADGMPDVAVANMISDVNRATGNVSVLLKNKLATLSANPHFVKFYARAGQASPGPIRVAIQSPTSGVTYSATSNQTWLNTNPTSNVTGASSTVMLKAKALSNSQAAMAAGTYSGTVQLAAPGFFGSSIDVTFQVTNPSGTIRALSNAQAGSGPGAVAVSDFNRDGKADFAVANFYGGNITVLLGNGGGGFTTASSPTVGTGPISIATADFNADGKPDLAVANSGDNNVKVMLGDGTGNFTAIASLFAGCSPRSVVAGDFNADGKQDLAVQDALGNPAVAPAPTVLLGDGTGRFTGSPASTCTPGPANLHASMAVGDFNGDGKLDLAAVGTSGSSVMVLFGDGHGNLAAVAGPALAGSSPGSVVIDDFNGDGKQDLAIGDTRGGITLLLGDGTGTFTPAPGSPFLMQSKIQSLAVADFNGDGQADLAVSDLVNKAMVLLGDGTGNMTNAIGTGWFTVGLVDPLLPASIAAGDFNGDGRPDLVVPTTSSANVVVLLGNPVITQSGISTTAGATIAYGTPVPLTMTVFPVEPAFNAPIGDVTFYDGTTPLATVTQTTGTYVFNAANLARGSHTLRAKYAGNARSVGSTSNTIIIQVQ